MALPPPSSRLPDFRRASLAAAGGGLERGPVPGGELGGAARVARGEATRGQRLLGMMIWLYLKTKEGSDISRFLVLA
jgi:hypothetical protein